MYIIFWVLNVFMKNKFLNIWIFVVRCCFYYFCFFVLFYKNFRNSSEKITSFRKMKSFQVSTHIWIEENKSSTSKLYLMFASLYSHPSVHPFVRLLVHLKNFFILKISNFLYLYHDRRRLVFKMYVFQFRMEYETILNTKN